MEAAYEKKYHENEKKHFWFKARRKYILQLLKDYPKNTSILDIGCSSGILLKELSEAGFDSENLFGVDISPLAIQNCRENGIRNAFVMDAQHITLQERFDVIISSDCLEHLEDDDKALQNWHALLKHGGTLFLFVPAFMFLWSEHDVVNMHYRRYTKKNLEQKLHNSNFEVQKASYWNFSLFMPIFLVRLLNRLRSKKEVTVNGDLEEPALLNGVFFNIINLENKALKYTNFPFGVSTFCIAKKKASDRKTIN